MSNISNSFSLKLCRFSKLRSFRTQPSTLSTRKCRPTLPRPTLPRPILPQPTVPARRTPLRRTPLRPTPPRRTPHHLTRSLLTQHLRAWSHPTLARLAAAPHTLDPTPAHLDPTTHLTTHCGMCPINLTTASRLCAIQSKFSSNQWTNAPS